VTGSITRLSIIDRGVAVVAVRGEIDLSNRAVLAEALSTATDTPDLRLLVCDLARVTFLSCAGISALVDVRSTVDGLDAELRVVVTEPAVLRVLDLTGQREPLGVCRHLDVALTRSRVEELGAHRSG
jgi:anti-anti-sigma factor